MTPILNLLIDIAGQTVGTLLDPVLWAIMIAAAFKVRMRWILPVSAVMALLVQIVVYFGEPPELQVYPFATLTLVGRTLAGWLVGSGARWFIVRRRARTPSIPPAI